MILALSVARTGALLRNYSAPMAVFRALPEVRCGCHHVLCIAMFAAYHKVAYHIVDADFKTIMVRHVAHHVRALAADSGLRCTETERVHW